MDSPYFFFIRVSMGTGEFTLSDTPVEVSEGDDSCAIFWIKKLHEYHVMTRKDTLCILIKCFSGPVI